MKSIFKELEVEIKLIGVIMNPKKYGRVLNDLFVNEIILDKYLLETHVERLIHREIQEKAMMVRRIQFSQNLPAFDSIKIQITSSSNLNRNGVPQSLAFSR